MKVKVVHWLRRTLPGWLQADAEGLHEVSAEDIVRLYNEGYDVMLTHSRPPVAQGHILVCLDDAGCKFRQR
jgi:hypothetical protein